MNKILIKSRGILLQRTIIDRVTCNESTKMIYLTKEPIESVQLSKDTIYFYFKDQEKPLTIELPLEQIEETYLKVVEFLDNPVDS